MHALSAGSNSWGYTGGVNFKGYFKIGFGEVRVRVRVGRGAREGFGWLGQWAQGWASERWRRALIL
jgi:hypothetical protein